MNSMGSSKSIIGDFMKAKKKVRSQAWPPVLVGLLVLVLMGQARRQAAVHRVGMISARKAHNPRTPHPTHIHNRTAAPASRRGS